MLAEVHYPEQLSPEALDAYLQQGWFRMGQTIFTTNFVHFHHQLYSAIWLRLILSEFTEERTQLKLFKRNARFRSEIKPATITEEKEDLYAHYKESCSFETSASLRQLLYRGADLTSVYNTYEVAVYDGKQLIAIGYFDLGGNSAEGITSVYHPAYKKFSLGKFLIYQKIMYCKQLGLTYFYPGYFVPGYASFDYKLSIGKNALEFLQLSSSQWLPLQRFSPASIPINVMEEKLEVLRNILMENNLVSSVLKYTYFDANLVPELTGTELFDFPIMLLCGIPSDDNKNILVVFDVCDEHYHLLHCAAIWSTGNLNEEPGFFSTHLLKIAEEILTTPFAEDLLSPIRCLAH